MTEPKTSRSITQELIYLRNENGHLAARFETVPLPDGSQPDAHARTHVGWLTHTPPGALAHSTSWRADPETGNIILTWAIAPDPNPELPAFLVRDDDPIAQGADAAHPVPKNLDRSHVIRHACRHMAFLLHTDERVSEAIHTVHPELHEALLRFAPHIAGNPHTPH